MARGWLLLFAALCLHAGTQTVGTVTAGTTVFVNGVSISTRGTPTWPLVSGDEVKSAAGEPAIVTLANGSRFVLQPASTLKISKCGEMEVEILEGSVAYQVSTATHICVRGRPVLGASQGTITFDKDDRVIIRTADQQTVAPGTGECRCSRRSLKPIIVIVAAAAAALAGSLALTLPSSVSPSAP